MGNSEFKAGDVVCLKSGGPSMTAGNMAVGGLLCYWFAGSELKKDTFPPEILKLDPPTQR
ncbi:MAG TPA: DUF2158 domain-containing protein [Polyangiaceae bacterium]|nr:DUF2158 domain-containing protein [Polyangiaceae bacterium]